MKLLYLAIVLMCLMSDLNTSTHAAKEDKEDKGKGKGNCPGVPLVGCDAFETKCCKTKDCEKGEFCCQTTCKFECLSEKEIKEKQSPIKTLDVNFSQEKCKKYNKTGSFVTTNPSVTID
ncbi:hypothetical protein TNCT_717261 [Trichonephila clavata]|uniref:WAP four-disulfide core domain protein 18-like n=1 Tax=Trichonephila clavata TaxID=2740835 RepID=A0A8X6EYY0_TRICU|nr:hypothetical protein TNCT_717261 [Trichonephila clavata]